MCTIHPFIILHVLATKCNFICLYSWKWWQHSKQRERGLPLCICDTLYLLDILLFYYQTKKYIDGMSGFFWTTCYFYLNNSFVRNKNFCNYCCTLNVLWLFEVYQGFKTHTVEHIFWDSLTLAVPGGGVAGRAAHPVRALTAAYLWFLYAQNATFSQFIIACFTHDLFNKHNFNRNRHKTC